MKTGICHYSLRRRYAAEKWDPARLVQEVKALGLDCVDFHAGILGKAEGAAEAVLAALAGSSVRLGSLSMSNNFNQDDPAKFKAQVDLVKAWLGVAAQVKAPASRIFGGHIPRERQGDASAAAAGKQRILDGLGQVEKEARRLGVVLALENHGGLPCSAEEQVAVIRQINSPFLRATIDVGNYMQCGQEGHVGTAIAAPYCAYTHFKDFRKLPDATIPRGYKLEACVIGEGEVDLRACVAALRKADYDGVIAIEYEGAEDETTAVPRSVANMKKAMT